MKHQVVRVDNLMYEGCEPHWKCIHCGICIPFHCFNKEQLEQQECKCKKYSGYAKLTFKLIDQDVIAKSEAEAEELVYAKVNKYRKLINQMCPDLCLTTCDVEYPHEIVEDNINE